MEREISLVEAIAAQAGVVIENAKYYDEQHRIAETLQESMLVMPREVEGLETLYQSATSAARVGGDFYDLFDISPGRVAMAVGDVSGKGLDASATTALARDTIRAHGITGAPPAVVMSRTNEALLRFTGGETFVTAIYGVLDVESGAFVFTNAGHPDGYVIGRSGYVRPLAGQCPLLGMLDDILFEEQVVVLAPNDTIFFYTDGVTEARRGRELYGSERLVEFLGSLKDNAPGLVTKTLFEELERFSGGALRDDVAMLAVRRVPRGRGDE
jgi:serine phosphatase RsbU (regulator of sigma subunit)